MFRISSNDMVMQNRKPLKNKCLILKFLFESIMYTRSSQFAASYIGSIYRLTQNCLIFQPSKCNILLLSKLCFCSTFCNFFLQNQFFIKIDKYIDDWVDVIEYRYRICTLAQSHSLAWSQEPTGVNLRASGVFIKCRKPAYSNSFKYFSIETKRFIVQILCVYKVSGSVVNF